MNYLKTGLALIFSGFLLFIILASFGLVKLGLFIIFPFAVSTSIISILPFLLIFIGFIVLFIYPFHNYENYIKNDYNDAENNYEYENNYYDNNYDDKNNYNKSKSKYSGFLLIGPVPIIFGNDRRLVYISIIIAVLIIIFYIILIFAHLL